MINTGKACVYVKSNHNKFFKLAVLAGLYNISVHPECITHVKPLEKRLNFYGIHFAVKPKNFTTFEKQNDVSVNVYKKFGDRKDVSPIHLT